MPGIPPIASYPMPQEHELPPNTARWSVDPRRAALLVHDMQRYFLAGYPVGQAPVTDLVRNAIRLREHCAALGVPVVYTAQPGGMTRQQRGLIKDFWGDGMTVAPHDRRIVDGLEPAPGDLVLTKWRYSAFQRTELAGVLRDGGRDQLLLCGVYANIGVLLSAADAFSADIQPFMVADAVADLTAGEHRAALGYAAARCAVVATTDTVLRQLGPAPGSRGCERTTSQAPNGVVGSPGYHVSREPDLG